MGKEKNKSTDVHIHGLESLGEAANTVAKGTVDGVGAFLGRICLPFAEEYGLYLQDKVKNWRANNFASIAQKAQNKLEKSGDIDQKFAHPRMVFQIFEHSSWIDNDNVQEMWAGLLASSCTKDGKDDSNLLFINILSQLTTSQVKILNYACMNSTKGLTKAGGIMAAIPLRIELDELNKISGINDFHRLYRELDHLRSLGLILVGFSPEHTLPDLAPTPLALHMYVRCQGSLQSPVDYFELNIQKQD